MAAHPEEYQWSSYRQYIGKEEARPWLQIEWLLSEYGTTYKTAGRKYREFVEAGIENPPGYPDDKIVGQAILGEEKFIRKVVKAVRSEGNLDEIVAKRHFSGRPGVDEIYRAVCNYYGTRELKDTKAQELFVCLAKEASSGLNREIAEKIGRKSPSAVSHQYRRAVKRMEEDRKLMRELEKDKTTILSRFKG